MLFCHVLHENCYVYTSSDVPEGIRDDPYSRENINPVDGGRLDLGHVEDDVEEENHV